MKRTVVLLLVMLLLPAIAGIGYSERIVLQRDDAFQPALPEKTTRMKTRVGILGGSVCRSYVAWMLATELSYPQLVAAIDAGPLVGQTTRLVWPDGIRVAGRVLGSSERLGEVPRAVDSLLKQHAFLPRGVRRAVLYREQALHNLLDPRCW